MAGRTKTRYNQKELKEFAKIIDEKIAEAKEQMSFYVQQLKESADMDNRVRGLDDSSTSVETERLQTMSSRLQKHIQHLENAKLRIQNKVYGICRVTGKLISKERLMAVPHATLSIEAKQEQR